MPQSAPEITAAALDGSDDVAAEAVDIFLSIVGAEAGAMALRCLAKGACACRLHERGGGGGAARRGTACAAWASVPKHAGVGGGWEGECRHAAL